MIAKLNEAQLAMLRWITDGSPGAEATNPQRLSARALANRRLVIIKGHGPRWRASLTPAGEHYLEHGKYPADHFGAVAERAAPVADTATVGGPRKGRAKKAARPAKPPVDLTVDSPRGKRQAGNRPHGDALFSQGSPDPYDGRVLITVKEAAWMLSLPENAIRAAALAGDLDRVFIGEGRKNYRVVYGSLLAWVNSMPRESAHHRWWR